MYSRRITFRHQRCGLVQPARYLTRQSLNDHGSSHSFSQMTVAANNYSLGYLIRRHILNPTSSRPVNPAITHLHEKFRKLKQTCQIRVYSSEGDGRNASENKHLPVIDGAKFNIINQCQDKAKEDIRNFDTHARLGEQDQREWLQNEKLAIESRKKESPFLTRRDKFKNELLRRVVPWEKITVSWETFPYYIK